MTLFGFNINISRASQPAALSAQKAFYSPEQWLRGEDLAPGLQLSNAYEQVVWVYRAINALAEQVANVPFLFSAGERGQENLITSGPLLDFYARPHPQMNRFQYWELRVIWLMLRGECFRVPIYEDGTTAGGGRRGSAALKKILLPDPALFQHIVEDHRLIGWHYTGLGTQTPLASQVFLPEEVWFEKLPNPFDFWRGLPPLYVAAMAAQTDFAAGAFMRGTIENNCDPGLIVRTDKWLSPQQREEIVGALRERKRRAGQADRPVLLLGSAEVIKPQLSSSDLQFLDNRKFSRSEICAAFGVPEEIVTTTDHAKYDVMAGARLNFIENRIAPLCSRLEAEEDVTVKSIDPRASGWFDLDSLPILQESRRNRLVAAKTGFEMGIPFNELNRVLDLGFKRLPWGDQGYLANRFQAIPDGSAKGEGGSAKEGAHTSAINGGEASPQPEGGEDFLRDARLLLPAEGQAGMHNPIGSAGDFLAGLNRSQPLANPQLARKLSRFFFEQRSRVLARLPGVPTALTQLANASDTPQPLLDLAAENEQLVETLGPLLVAELESACTIAGRPLPAAQAGEAYLQSRRPPLEQLNHATLAALEEALVECRGQARPLEALTARVKAIYNAAEARARAVARNEAAAARLWCAETL